MAAVKPGGEEEDLSARIAGEEATAKASEEEDRQARTAGEEAPAAATPERAPPDSAEDSAHGASVDRPPDSAQWNDTGALVDPPPNSADDNVEPPLPRVAVDSHITWRVIVLAFLVVVIAFIVNHLGYGRE
jgi:hypothetical protein